MKKFNKTPLTLAMGTAVVSGFAINAQAESNPFTMTDLATGYMVAEYSNKTNHGACGSNVADANGNKINKSAKASKSNAAPKTKKAEGSCGEGMCGGMMEGGKMKKGMEGMCGEMMKGKEGSCGMMGGGMKGMSGMGGMEGMDHGAMGDMKGMDHGDMAEKGEAKSEEGSCGAMMKGGDSKGEEGSCGAMMKGGEGSCGSKVEADKAAGE